jgi:DNA-binding FrmR family transcriptional regulator
MKFVKQATSDQITKQLSRIRGQVDGVARMYEENRSCVEIARQIAAVRSSLARVARDILTGEASRCSRNDSAEELDLVLKELLKY